MRPDLHVVITDSDPDSAGGRTPLPRPRDAFLTESAVAPVGDGTAPHPDECLPCYVLRLLDRHGCDGSLRWSMRWRDARAPRARKLDQRLGDRGGFCDCEVLFNVYPGHDPGGGCDGRVGGEATTPCRRPRATWW